MMSGPTPESLAMDCGLKCDMCKEEVNYGDDYIAHLQFAHSVTQNIPFFMNKALAKIKGEKRKIADVVTLEEEESTEEIFEEAKRNEVALALDASTKENIEKTVEKTMDDLFKGIRSLLEGKVPLEEADESDNVDDVDPAAADEKIWQRFENLKEVVNNIEFPIELLQQLAASKSTDREVVGQSEDTLQELVAPSIVDEEATQLSRPSSRKKSHEAHSQVSTPITATAVALKPNPSTMSNPTPPIRQQQALSNSNKLAPVNSAQSDKSNACNTGKSFFLCPVEHCKFFTTKQGMLDGTVANHLNKTHKVTGADMKTAAPGTYKFKKVKGEPRL